MGDIKKIRKKYQTPMHPWSASRIAEERTLRTEYGLGNKKEIWKMNSLLTRLKDRAKLLIAQQGSQADKERDQLVQRMARLGLIKTGATFDDILSLSLHDVMNRRLETLLVRKHLARSAKQARQMVTHRHVLVAGKMVTSPSYLVSVEEEPTITFAARSPFLNEQHPERFSEAELEERRQRAEAKKKVEKKKEEEVLAYDEKAIKEAEALVGEAGSEGEK
jgi:small subunit ribosomal protein S4